MQECDFRNIAISEAISRANNFFHSQGYSYTIQSFGGNKFPVYAACGQDGVTSAGKGLGNQSLASCLFELAEHRALENPFHLKDLSLCEVPEINKATIFLLDKSIKDFFTLNQGKKFGGVKLESLNGEKAIIPAALATPCYERLKLPKDNSQQQGLAKYFSSIGFAAGSDFMEAVLHGMMEVIEHDCISDFIVNCILRGGREIEVLDKTTCPSSLLEVIYEAEDTLHCDLELLLWRGTNKSPTVLALPVAPQPVIGYFGASFSLCSVHAAQRAVLELRQDYILRTQCYLGDKEEHPSSGLTHPMLKELSRFDFSYITKRNSIKRISISESHFDMAKDKMYHAISACMKNDTKVFHKPVETGTNEVAVVLSYAPGMDSFSVSRSGFLVAPRVSYQ